MHAAPIPLVLGQCDSGCSCSTCASAAVRDSEEPLLKREKQLEEVELSEMSSEPVVGIRVRGMEEDEEEELRAREATACFAHVDACGIVGWFGQRSSTTIPSSWLRLALLAAVMLQNAGYALLRSYSRGTLKERYSSSSALLAMELVKLVLSAWQLVSSTSMRSDVPDGSALSKYAHLLHPRRSAKMAVPAVIYLAMNLLSFYALGRVDASTFTIASQLKVLTTAVFAVTLLGRSLAPRKWRALLTLTLGVLLITTEVNPAGHTGGAGASGADGGHGGNGGGGDSASAAAPPGVGGALAVVGVRAAWLMGLGAVLLEVVLSGFASIYFEKVLKSAEETYSVWDRNFQLAVWSIAIYLPIALHEHPDDPFAGWSWVAGGCAAAGALGGVLVALSLKYADSVTKTMATTGSIVLTTLLNASFLDGPFSLPITCGALIVVVSVFNFGDNGDTSDRC